MDRVLPELSKVILGMECCIKAGAIMTSELGIIGGDECAMVCPYRDESGHCLENLARDCLYRLKMQEPVKPERSGKGATWYYCCGACGQPIDPGDPYCRKCGKKVKWDD